jgi:hypothetical protein
MHPLVLFCFLEAKKKRYNHQSGIKGHRSMFCNKLIGGNFLQNLCGKLILNRPHVLKCGKVQAGLLTTLFGACGGVESRAFLALGHILSHPCMLVLDLSLRQNENQKERIIVSGKFPNTHSCLENCNNKHFTILFSSCAHFLDILCMYPVGTQQTNSPTFWPLAIIWCNQHSAEILPHE